MTCAIVESLNNIYSCLNIIVKYINVFGGPQESYERLKYLLDVYFFSSDDIDLNSEVLTWPKVISPIFDRNDEVGGIP